MEEWTALASGVMRGKGEVVLACETQLIEGEQLEVSKRRKREKSTKKRAAPAPLRGTNESRTAQKAIR